MAEDPTSGVSFDERGPRIGRIPLVRRTALGFVPRPLEELSKILAHARDTAVDMARLDTNLFRLCRAMNSGDLSLAGIIAGDLILRPLSEFEIAAALDADRLLKAGVNDPKHPGYAAHTPGGKGGQFRPKDGGVTFVDRRAAKLKQLDQRRGFRAALRRVLTWKRLLRLAEKNAVAAVTEEVPVLDVATDAAAVTEDLALIGDIAQEVRNSEAAIKFLEESTGELDSLVMDTKNIPFKSYADFKKIEVEKFYGSAGDGFEYHHIVEQGPNAGVLPNGLLQSTENIIRIPKLLHEEITAIYAARRDFQGVQAIPREYLRGRSYDEQRAFGLKVLREVGIIR